MARGTVHRTIECTASSEPCAIPLRRACRPPYAHHYRVLLLGCFLWTCRFQGMLILHNRFLGMIDFLFLLGVYGNNVLCTLQVLPGGIALEMTAILASLMRVGMPSLQIRRCYPALEASIFSRCVSFDAQQQVSHILHVPGVRWMDTATRLAYSCVEFMNTVFASEDFELREEPK